jgi:hypothetical protein
MTRSKKTWLILLTIACVLFLSICGYLVLDGFDRFLEVKGVLLRAQEHWQKGEVFRATVQLGLAVQMSVEGQIRWPLARIYLSRSDSLLQDGQLEEALQQCITANRIVGRYQNEGVVFYRCYVIAEKIFFETGRMPSLTN